VSEAAEAVSKLDPKVYAYLAGALVLGAVLGVVLKPLIKPCGCQE
jgi:hypothetical protein